MIRSLKKKQQKLQADQDLLNDRWNNVLASEEYGLECPTKSYPERKLLPQLDDEAPEPIPPTRNAADGPDRPPRGQDRTSTQAEHQPAPPRRKSRETTARGYTYDLRQDLEKRAGQTRSIYRSWGRALVREDGYQAWRDKQHHARAENRIRTSSELRRDAARYRGAAHPLCFTYEVMEQKFP